MVYRTIPVVVALLLAACSDPGQWGGNDESESTDITDVTSVTEVTSVGGMGGAERPMEGEGRQVEAKTEGSGESAAAQPLDLSVEFLPKDRYAASDSEADYLFAEKDDGVNFFQSREKERRSVKVKGKLYMIEEPVPERRLDNVDGGEIGIELPLP